MLHNAKMTPPARVPVACYPPCKVFGVVFNPLLHRGLRAVSQNQSTLGASRWVRNRPGLGEESAVSPGGNAASLHAKHRYSNYAALQLPLLSKVHPQPARKPLGTKEWQETLWQEHSKPLAEQSFARVSVNVV